MKQNERGSLLMEAILVLPVLLLISMGAAQFAHLWLCRTMVHYAAVSAARATLTSTNGNALSRVRSAAEIICSSIAFINPSSSDTQKDFTLPGITPPSPGNNNSLQGSGCVRNNSILAVHLLTRSNGWAEDRVSGTDTPLDSWHRGVQVNMRVPLLFPVAGPVIGKCMELYSGGNFSIAATAPTADDPVVQLANDLFPRITLREKVYIVKPFQTSWSQD